MSKVINSALELIGNTPLLNASRYAKNAGIEGVKSSAHQRVRILLRKTRSKILCSPEGSHFASQNKEDLYEIRIFR